MSSSEIPKFIPATEVAERLGVSRKTLSSLSKKGVLPEPINLSAGDQRRAERYSEAEILDAIKRLSKRGSNG